MQPLEAIPLAPHTTIGLGGPARYFLRASEPGAVVAAIRWANQRGLPCRVLGGGSNVVVADRGFDGLVIQIATRGISETVQGDVAQVEAAAGEPWDDLVAHTVERGWAGLECLSGIPGCVGATPIQNVGAYGQEVARTIESVRVHDRQTGKTIDLSARACEFGYRDSHFKSTAPDRYVVMAVRFRLRVGGAPDLGYPQIAQHVRSGASLSEVRDAVIAVRREKSMLLDPTGANGRSCGSFFTNPVVDRNRLPDPTAPHWPQADGRIKLAAAWLIEQAGFRKGQRDGRVGLSSHHALALVCDDGARTEDLVRFATRVRDAVQARFGIGLVPEPAFWGFSQLRCGLPSLDGGVQ